MGWRQALANWIGGREGAGAISVKITDDNPLGWVSHTGRPHDRDYGEVQQLYLDALTAWRENPLAKRVVETITNFCLGDGISVSSKDTDIELFIRRFWGHRKNLMDVRLSELSDELSRAGDLFVTLHTNPMDGMSYVRVVPKDLIVEIRSQENDWETEIEYDEAQPDAQLRTWFSPDHPQAATATAVMLHYRVNRPAGAILGESDLATMLEWMRHYATMVQNRIRLHWALRAFLWVVTVPTRVIPEKQSQYRKPPEPGSIIVKDDGERWEVISPEVHGADASYDMRAVRMMIDAGSGQPPHWRGEGETLNLATARAMTDPAVRTLRRRQLYIRHMLVDLVHQAYTRAHNINPRDYGSPPDREVITAVLPDINRDDDEVLAMAAKNLSDALAQLQAQLPGRSSKLQRLILSLVLKFSGEPQPESVIDEIMEEATNGQPVTEVEQ